MWFKCYDPAWPRPSCKPIQKTPFVCTNVAHNIAAPNMAAQLGELCSVVSISGAQYAHHKSRSFTIIHPCPYYTFLTKKPPTQSLHEQAPKDICQILRRKLGSWRECG
ncbi:hypothetical protein BRAS3843_100042 [Bradyrhizobium sp. STM 3843]|nr:hypothetical protein BRAS3843_100042 [Bradyrhizobium sp. STM 3843]